MASFRTTFTEVVLLPVLRAQLKAIQPWLEDDQVEEVIEQLTVSFPSGNLLPRLASFDQTSVKRFSGFARGDGGAGPARGT